MFARCVLCCSTGCARLTPTPTRRVEAIRQFSRIAHVHVRQVLSAQHTQAQVAGYALVIPRVRHANTSWNRRAAAMQTEDGHGDPSCGRLAPNESLESRSDQCWIFSISTTATSTAELSEANSANTDLWRQQGRNAVICQQTGSGNEARQLEQAA